MPTPPSVGQAWKCQFFIRLDKNDWSETIWYVNGIPRYEDAIADVNRAVNFFAFNRLKGLATGGMIDACRISPYGTSPGPLLNEQGAYYRTSSELEVPGEAATFPAAPVQFCSDFLLPTNVPGRKRVWQVRGMPGRWQQIATTVAVAPTLTGPGVTWALNFRRRVFPQTPDERKTVTFSGSFGQRGIVKPSDALRRYPIRKITTTTQGYLIYHVLTPDPADVNLIVNGQFTIRGLRLKCGTGASGAGYIQDIAVSTENPLWTMYVTSKHWCCGGVPQVKTPGFLMARLYGIWPTVDMSFSRFSFRDTGTRPFGATRGRRSKVCC